MNKSKVLNLRISDSQFKVTSQDTPLELGEKGQMLALHFTIRMLALESFSAAQPPAAAALPARLASQIELDFLGKDSMRSRQRRWQPVKFYIFSICCAVPYLLMR